MAWPQLYNTALSMSIWHADNNISTCKGGGGGGTTVLEYTPIILFNKSFGCLRVAALVQFTVALSISGHRRQYLCKNTRQS